MMNQNKNDASGCEIERFRNSGTFHLLPTIRLGLFHCTTVQGVRGIIQAGSIIPNKGKFEFTYPQSANSYALSKGWISLFDFAGTTEEHCISQHWKWESFFISRTTIKIALKLDREKLISKLISNSARPRLGHENYKIAIPYVEAWYPEPIKIQYIYGCLIAFPLREKDNSYEIIEFSLAEFEHYMHRIQNRSSVE